MEQTKPKEAPKLITFDRLQPVRIAAGQPIHMVFHTVEVINMPQVFKDVAATIYLTNMEERKFPDIMVDIETMGDRMDAVILSIAAVPFDMKTGEIGERFYIRVDIQDCLDHGLEVTGGTIKWWLTKSVEARMEASQPGTRLGVALEALSSFINKHDAHNVKVWARGPRFDFGILDTAFKVANIEIPWNKSNEHCVRTIELLNPNVKKLITDTRIDVEHYAPDDCLTQIKYCSKIWEDVVEAGYKYNQLTK